jgi:hypothetical protein
MQSTEGKAVAVQASLQQFTLESDSLNAFDALLQAQASGESCNTRWSRDI